MSGTNIVVRYKGVAKMLSLNLDGTYLDLRNKIATSFKIAQTDQFHIIVKDEENGDSTDIDDDFNVRSLSRIRLRFSIDVYPGGPFWILFGKELWSLIRMPAPGTCLVQKSKRILLPDYSKAEFTKTLNKLLVSVDSANTCLILTANEGLSFKLNRLCAEHLRPVSVSCSLTFKKIAEKNQLLVESLIKIFQHLRDRLPPSTTRDHIQKITDLASHMRVESGQRVDDLRRTENDLNHLLLRPVEDTTENAIAASQDEGYIGYLRDAIKSLRWLRTVMNELKQFWVNIEELFEHRDGNVFMTDLRQVCESGQITGSRSEEFKTEGAISIARPVAIKEVCMECHLQMKEFIGHLAIFLERVLDYDAAQRRHDERLDRDEPEYPEEERVYDAETVTAVGAKLEGLPYRGIDGRDEEGDADIPMLQQHMPEDDEIMEVA